MRVLGNRSRIFVLVWLEHATDEDGVALSLVEGDDLVAESDVRRELCQLSGVLCLGSRSLRLPLGVSVFRCALDVAGVKPCGRRPNPEVHGDRVRLQERRCPWITGSHEPDGRHYPHRPQTSRIWPIGQATAAKRSSANECTVELMFIWATYPNRYVDSMRLSYVSSAGCLEEPLVHVAANMDVDVLCHSGTKTLAWSRASDKHERRVWDRRPYWNMPTLVHTGDRGRDLPAQ